jgi:hypothetical protein
MLTLIFHKDILVFNRSISFSFLKAVLLLFNNFLVDPFLLVYVVYGVVDWSSFFYGLVYDHEFFSSV